MSSVARDGDLCTGFCMDEIHSPNIPFPATGKIISSTSKTAIDGRGVARLGDTVVCDCGYNHTGFISSASSNFFIEGAQVARVGDSVNGTFVATIVEGSSKFNLS